MIDLDFGERLAFELETEEVAAARSQPRKGGDKPFHGLFVLQDHGGIVMGVRERQVVYRLLIILARRWTLSAGGPAF